MRAPRIVSAGLLWLALSFAGSTTQAQDIVAADPLPSFPAAPGEACGAVQSPSPGRWLVEAYTPGQHRPEQIAHTVYTLADPVGAQLVFFTGLPGVDVAVLFVPDDATQPLSKTWVTLGGVAPDPVDPDPDPDPDPTPAKVTQAVYVYDRDEGAIPPAVMGALAQVNEGDTIIAVPYEVDQRDGDDEVPDRFRLAYTTGVKTGMPVLVIVYDDGTTRTAEVETAEDVLAAVKGVE